MNGFETINPEFVVHEGFYYLVWQGEYFKGCRRCGGSGHYTYNGEHDRCYECDNTSAKLGAQLDSKEAAEKWCHQKALRRAAADRKREREYQKKLDGMKAKQEALKASDPDVYEFLMGLDIEPVIFNQQGEVTALNSKVEKNSFLVAMVENLTYESMWEKPFSEKMIAGVRKTIESRAAKEATKTPVVEGRIVLTGKVISTKAVEGDYGTSYKMLVEDNRGFRVYGSIPSSLWNEVEFLGDYRKNAWDETEGVMTKLKGMEVTFTATVETSRDDKAFGFFKRPTKAALVVAE